MASEWSNIVVATITLASIYALLGSGFVILFRATKVLSFAQGSFMLIGGSIFYTFLTAAHLEVYLALICSIGATGVVGWLTYVVVFSRMIGGQPFVISIATLGLATLFEGAGYLIWGAQQLQLPLVFSYEPKVLLGTFHVNDIDEFVVILTAALSILVALGLRYTKIGMQMKAVADAPRLAAYSGIHVSRISGFAWGIAAALAGAGGVAYAVSNGLDPGIIPGVGLTVFPVIILGGLDSFGGVFVGAILISLLQTMIGIYVGGNWQGPLAYVVLLIVLLIRPQGIFGSRDVVRI
jgi:branched-chain amino acid transport system permease protein